MKDLCARLIHKVKAAYYDSEEGRESVDTIDGIDITSEPEILIGQYGLRIEAVKPYLRPMESMTDEEKDEIIKLTRDSKKQEWTFSHQCYYYLDWLNAHHFDYRHLIEKGLALEARDGMYNN